MVQSRALRSIGQRVHTYAHEAGMSLISNGCHVGQRVMVDWGHVHEYEGCVSDVRLQMDDRRGGKGRMVELFRVEYEDGTRNWHDPRDFPARPMRTQSSEPTVNIQAARGQKRRVEEAVEAVGVGRLASHFNLDSSENEDEDEDAVDEGDAAEVQEAVEKVEAVKMVGTGEEAAKAAAAGAEVEAEAESEVEMEVEAESEVEVEVEVEAKVEAEVEMDAEAEGIWVACDRCGKWRRLMQVVRMT